MKKIVMQLLADSLGLSRVTVWKVLNKKPGVAPATVERVLDAVEKLREDEAEPKNQNKNLKTKSILLITSRADTSSFWMSILEKITSELSRNHFTMEYLPLNAMHLSDNGLLESIRNSKAAGAVILNIYDRSTLAALSSINIPKVYFDTVPELSCKELKADLLLLDGRQALYEITQNLIQSGCQKIGFIGDITYAKTNQLRFEGFCRAMAENSLAVSPALCFTNMPDKIEYTDGIEQFLAQCVPLPQAFVCANDHLAFTVMRLLGTRNIAVPVDIILTGYDNQREYMLEQNQITTVNVRKGDLGKRLVHQLLYRIKNPCADFEEIQILPQILYRLP